MLSRAANLSATSVSSLPGPGPARPGTPSRTAFPRPRFWPTAAPTLPGPCAGVPAWLLAGASRWRWGPSATCQGHAAGRILSAHGDGYGRNVPALLLRGRARPASAALHRRASWVAQAVRNRDRPARRVLARGLEPAVHAAPAVGAAGVAQYVQGQHRRRGRRGRGFVNRSRFPQRRIPEIRPPGPHRSPHYIGGP